MVLNRNSRNDTYHVQRVDFGAKHWTNIEYVGQLPEEFHKTPPQVWLNCMALVIGFILAIYM